MWPRNRNWHRSASPKWKRFRDSLFAALRHPLSTVAVGFFLTAVVGGFISSYNDAVTERRRALVQRVDSATKVATAMGNVLSKARELASAIRENASVERIASLRKSFDEASDHWHDQLGLLPLLARTVSVGQDKTAFFWFYGEAAEMIRIVELCARRAAGELDNSSAIGVLDKCPKPPEEDARNSGGKLSPSDVKGAWRWMDAFPKIERQFDRADGCFYQVARVLLKVAEADPDDRHDPLGEELEDQCDLGKSGTPDLRIDRQWLERNNYEPEPWYMPRFLRRWIERWSE